MSAFAELAWTREASRKRNSPKAQNEALWSSSRTGPCGRIRSSLFRRSHVPGTHSNRARRRRRRVVAAHRLRELLPKQDRVIVIDRERDHLNLHWLLVRPFLRKKDNAE